MRKEKIIQSIVGDCQKIAYNTKLLIWFIGTHIFLTVLFLIFIDLILGLFLFYKYVYVAQNQDLEIISNQTILLDEKKYQLVLDEWEKREETFDNKEIQNIISPFK